MPMKYLVIAGRVLLGLPLVLFGAFGFIVVMPDPKAIWENAEGFDPDAAALLLTMWDSGFLMQSVTLTHLAAGIFILLNRFVPLALLVHLPVSLQMTLFHLCLDPATGAIAYGVLALNLGLLYCYRNSLSPLLEPIVEINKSS